MRAPPFWWAPAPTGLARLLSPAGAIYGRVASRRLRRPGAEAGVPVICVGNLVAGGAGKTPTALAVARQLAALGERPVMLTRGYGGRERGPVLVAPDSSAPERAASRIGDEAGELSALWPTVVSRDRVAGARLAAAAGTAVVMDDGLQNPSLAKDLSLAVIDAAVGLGNGLVIPAGPLRAPLSAQAPLVDALVLLEGAEGEGGLADVEEFAPGAPRIRARLAADAAILRAILGRPVHAFAGIGRPGKMFASLRALGVALERAMPFADHAPFSRATIETLRRAAREANAALVTTAKDARRVADAFAPDPPPRELLVLEVAVRFEDEGALRALLAGTLKRARERA